MSESAAPAQQSMQVVTPRRHRSQRPDAAGLRRDLYDIIFEADTTAGRGFDIALLIAILISIAITSLGTVKSLHAYDDYFEYAEWALTLLFTAEYLLRLYCVRSTRRYIFSFWGVVDLLSILPTYVVSFVDQTSRSFVMLRSIRLLRVFRVLKLWRMMSEAEELGTAVWRARNKVVVFLSVVLVAVTISGSLMYQIESVGGPEDNQFTSIPQAMYWAIVTMTTVGYGDIVPHTIAGKMISAALILLGYSLIIVPTGFVSAEMSQKKSREPPINEGCPNCSASPHRSDAKFCFNCGVRLDR